MSELVKELGASHTPGPWTQYAHGSTVYGGDGFFITAVQSKNPTTDARLIAAAPELLAALAAIFDGVEDEGGDPDDILLLPLTNREVAFARAIISKAEGAS